MRHFPAIASLALMILALSCPPVRAEKDLSANYTVAVLQGLNKITTKTSDIEAPTGTAVRFGNIEIVVRHCWKAPPEEKPEVAALLEIWDIKPDEPPSRIFLGWMFASSPALSALEHPVYDVVVKDCTSKAKTLYID